MFYVRLLSRAILIFYIELTILKPVWFWYNSLLILNTNLLYGSWGFVSNLYLIHLTEPVGEDLNVADMSSFKNKKK